MSDINSTEVTDSSADKHKERLQLSLPSWTMTALAWLVCVGAVLVAVTVAIKLNDRYGWFKSSGKGIQGIAVVDVESVLEPYKRDFVTAMSAAKLADADRDRANETVRRASVAVSVAVKSIASECQCALFVRTAVFNPEVLDDHTDLLAQRTADLLKQAAQISMSGTPSPTDSTKGAKQ
jgi:hypothetical protein